MNQQEKMDMMNKMFEMFEGMSKMELLLIQENVQFHLKELEVKERVEMIRQREDKN